MNHYYSPTNLLFAHVTYLGFAVVRLRVRLYLRFLVHLARTVSLEKVSNEDFWLVFVVCWNLFRHSPFDQFPLSNTMVLSMIEFLTLMSCRSCVSRIRSLLFKQAKSLLPLSRMRLDENPPVITLGRDVKIEKIYFLFMLICFLDFSTIHSFWVIACNISLVQSLYALWTAFHHFWYCTFAVQDWTVWLAKFQHCWARLLIRDMVLLFRLKTTSCARTTYGYSLFVVLYIVRSVIFAVFGCIPTTSGSTKF